MENNQMDYNAGLEELDSNLEQGQNLDCFKQYLWEIGQIPLLSAQEECQLAAQIRAGRESAQLLAQGQVTEEERQLCQRLVRQGEDARQKLVEANLRLVVRLAKEYLGRGLTLPDLTQAGNLGLMRAAEDYDERTGNRFSTYASHWINQHISRAVADQSRTIRLPVHTHSAVNRLRRVERELSVTLDREPTVEELAQKLGVSVKKVVQLKQYAQETVSLNQPAGDGDDSSELGDFLPGNESFDQLEREMSKNALDDSLRKVLSALNEKERYVICGRYGLFGTQAATLEKLGNDLGLTRERVRQIENKAMRKLRASASLELLRDFIA